MNVLPLPHAATHRISHTCTLGKLGNAHTYKVSKSYTPECVNTPYLSWCSSSVCGVMF